MSDAGAEKKASLNALVAEFIEECRARTRAMRELLDALTYSSERVSVAGDVLVRWRWDCVDGPVFYRRCTRDEAVEIYQQAMAVDLSDGGNAD